MQRLSDFTDSQGLIDVQLTEQRLDRLTVLTL